VTRSERWSSSAPSIDIVFRAEGGAEGELGKAPSGWR
jgi:hypothetical protein